MAKTFRIAGTPLNLERLGNFCKIRTAGNQNLYKENLKNGKCVEKYKLDDIKMINGKMQIV